MSSSVIPATTPVSWTAVPDGSAASPSFAFQNSSGTGFYRVSANVLGISTAGVQRVVVDASGNVGVGTASPGRKLDIVGADNTPSARLTLSANTNGAWQGIEFVHGAYIKTGIRSYSTGVTDAGALTFLTAPAGDVPNERMRIDSGGNLLVGSPTSVTRFVVRGPSPADIMIIETPLTSGTHTGLSYKDGNTDLCGYVSINATANTVTYTNSSDARLKTNHRDFDGLSLVNQMKPSKYERICNPGVDEIGLVAQELALLLPEAVAEGAEDVNEKPWGVDYGRITPVLVKAIQELSAKVDAQAAEIEALKAK